MSNLEIVTWNVAHGSAMYVRTPNNRSILLDGGASEDFSPARHLHDRYGLRATDMFILSHGDCDHVRDLPEICRLVPPRSFCRNPTAPRALTFPTDPPTADPLRTLDLFQSGYNDAVPAGELVSVPTNWGGVEVQLFWNDGNVYEFDCLNDYSVVTVMNYGMLCFVFPGDLEAPGWEAMMARTDFLRATTQARYRVLVAPHHGHTAGVYSPFLAHFQPHLTLISGAYGDPHTDSRTYDAASIGLPVVNKSAGTMSTCRVLTTKRNDHVLLQATDLSLRVSV
jgi:competence protein ComEC